MKRQLDWVGGFRGFSLIELLVVAAIIAILAGLLLPHQGYLPNYNVKMPR